ncbi:MAG: hypothetical protein K2M47_02805 [Clostridiales bacterium]|nr:hypothetical protein [Clostridiales bacterium]
MENKNLNAAVYVFTCIVILGLWLITIGMFASFVDMSIPNQIPTANGITSDSLALFDSSWKMLDGASPLFAILSYVVLIIGLAIVAIDSTIRQKLKKNVKGLKYAGFTFAVVGFVLLIVSMVLTKNDVQYAMNNALLDIMKQTGQTGGLSDETIKLTLRIMLRYDLGMGSIMAILGGVIALIGSILLLIPVFDPIKSATKSVANTAAPANTGYTLPDLTATNGTTGGGLASVKPFDPQYANDNANNSDTNA